MRLMSATDASRRFASVLDEAERGNTIIVTRGGRRIAVIGPAPGASGRVLKDVLRHHRGRLDSDWEDDMAAGRASTTDAIRPAWPDA